MSEDATRYPECFEDGVLLALHEAFLCAADDMRTVGPGGKGYWDIKHAAQNVLEAMDKIEDACYEWRSYWGDHDTLWGENREEEN